MKLTPADMINAITAGRRPFSTPRIAGISPYLKKSFVTIMHSIKDGVTNPIVAAIEPGTPATFIPQNVAALIPIGPGVICEIVNISTNSLNVIQP